MKLEPTANGGQRCYFDIKYKDENKVDFIPVTLWNDTARQFVENARNGYGIHIEGKLRRNTGTDRKKYLVIDVGIIRIIVPDRN